MSCKSPLVWFCDIPIGRFSPFFSLKTTKARVIQNEACKYIGVKPDLYDPIEEDVKAGLECIAYQITDLTLRMAQTQVCRFPSCARTAAPLRTST